MCLGNGTKPRTLFLELYLYRPSNHPYDNFNDNFRKTTFTH